MSRLLYFNPPLTGLEGSLNFLDRPGPAFNEKLCEEKVAPVEPAGGAGAADAFWDLVARESSCRDRASFPSAPTTLFYRGEGWYSTVYGDRFQLDASEQR